MKSEGSKVSLATHKLRKGRSEVNSHYRPFGQKKKKKKSIILAFLNSEKQNVSLASGAASAEWNVLS